MTKYKLNYLSTPNPKAVIPKRSRPWAASLVTGIICLVFTMLFFGGLGTAFRFRGQHLTLREQHDALRLRYDSLYAAKLQTDRQLKELQKQLEFLQRQPRPSY
ncbi:hypothetical protein [Runella slithyformis]|uniref:Uncharacterized protein n=1 Tax=Runella slithyformis (strain ATCC 29530 / DSM 19594 / LMG 11500 / NCIMB 11436 / LSU 4) TaxID=761193 RepID=A0A7U3ZMR7_RUNSL|nr:hypothetical protein [Runella slithyformis]AEI50059.1 hypothetical protein Runsl_3701 [Runella slithyformis DSM 19594]